MQDLVGCKPVLDLDSLKTVSLRDSIDLKPVQHVNSLSFCLHLVKAIREITDTMLAVNAAVNFVIYVVFNLSVPVKSNRLERLSPK